MSACASDFCDEGGKGPTRFIYGMCEQTAPKNASRTGGAGGYQLGTFDGNESEWLSSFFPEPASGLRTDDPESDGGLWRKDQSEISLDVRGKTDRSGGSSLSWRELKAVRKSPAEHGEPWRRFGAWWSISPMTGQDTTANVEWPGLKTGEGWYGANSSLWTQNLARLRRAGVRRVLLHLPFGKVTGNDMEFTRFVRCEDGYPGVHGPLPWLVKGFTQAMRALRKDGVSVIVYYGTMNCFRQKEVNKSLTGAVLGDTLLRGPFHEIEPNWNLSDPENPATRYSSTTSAAAAVSVSLTRKALPLQWLLQASGRLGPGAASHFHSLFVLRVYMC